LILYGEFLVKGLVGPAALEVGMGAGWRRRRVAHDAGVRAYARNSGGPAFEAAWAARRSGVLT